MSEVTYDALKNRIAELESRLQEATRLLLQAHDTIFRLHENNDVAARNLITKIRLGFSGTAGGEDENSNH
jgi:ABC-type molybdate transport system ATPase subunit